MTRFPRALAFLLIFAVLTVSGGLFINNAIDRPIKNGNVRYTADFVNATGLRVGNDVRTRGARIGKVIDISLHRVPGAFTNFARVQFELAGDARVFDNSHLAIRYLNLTGIRYVDLQLADRPGSPVSEDVVLGTDSTTASFDITTVFDGLAPAFSVMEPDDINHFAESLLALVDGDGSSFPQFVSSLTKVVQFADDRSALITTLVNNLAELSESIDGRAEFIDPIIGYVSRFGTVLAQWTPDLRNLADHTGDLLVQADYLLAAIGLRPNRTPDAETAVVQFRPLAEAGIGLLSLAPGVLESINSVVPPAGSANQIDRTCSNGTAELPAGVQFFLRGSQVTLCKR